MRRAPAPVEASDVITNGPISPVRDDVGAAAELLREVAGAHHAHALAVLLLEQAHRPALGGLLAAHDLPLDRLVLGHAAR